MHIKLFGQLVATFSTRVIVVSAAMSTPALAGNAGGGSITFAPLGGGGVTSVPTLGTAALILLALLLGFIGWVSMRKNGPGAVSSISLAVAVLAGSSAGGLHWVQNADAGGGFLITNADGQTFGVSPNVLNTYTNNAGIPMRPTAINYGSCSQRPYPSTCTIGTPVAPEEYCAIQCAGGNASDIRLKEGITRVATAANGLPLYEYSYRGESAVYRGVMAQDVLLHTPAAVSVMSNGYLAVDYGMLDLELVRVR